MSAAERPRAIVARFRTRHSRQRPISLPLNARNARRIEQLTGYSLGELRALADAPETALPLRMTGRGHGRRFVLVLDDLPAWLRRLPTSRDRFDYAESGNSTGERPLSLVAERHDIAPGHVSSGLGQRRIGLVRWIQHRARANCKSSCART